MPAQEPEQCVLVDSLSHHCGMSPCSICSIDSSIVCRSTTRSKLNESLCVLCALSREFLSKLRRDLVGADNPPRPTRWSKELWLELARCVGDVDRLGLIELMEQKALRLITTIE
jgi:hypothetical protein